jgi:hypothetical protein
VDRASKLTDIKDIEQVRKLTKVLLEYTQMQFWQKAWREVQFYEARVKPMEAVNTDLETWLPDPIRKQLFSTGAEGSPTIRHSTWMRIRRQRMIRLRRKYTSKQTTEVKGARKTYEGVSFFRGAPPYCHGCHGLRSQPCPLLTTTRKILLPRSDLNSH